ncbi:hypothetical protein C0J52_10078, partial [Blattella germanica]
RYDLDETFSPPSYDDSFFYIRYPKIEKSTKSVQEPSFQRTSELLEKSEQIAKQDFSQHTVQCRQFIPEVHMGSAGPSEPFVKTTRSSKPTGTDDGFISDSAACGKSVVQVAHQMIAGNLVRGFSTTGAEHPATGEGFNKNKRRGSKSLPSSPLSTPPHSPDSSPQSRRRVQNRYFTGAFTLERANINPSGNYESANKYPGSWILSGLLGQQQREKLSDSVESITIPEEDHSKVKESSIITKSENKKVQKPQPTEIKRNKSMTSLVSRMFNEGSKDVDTPIDIEVGVDVAASAVSGNNSPTQKKVFRAKPSELREMNFWSPTSM